MQSRTPWDSDKTWRGKAKRIIHKQCEQSYRQANPLPRKKHKPYHVPEFAKELLDCLNTDDEVRAKGLFHSYEGMKAIGV